MKEYVNEIVKNAKKVADAIVVKTSETVDAAKVEIEIRKAQASLDREYKALGQIMFQVEKGAMTRDDAVIDSACERIQAQIDLIADLGIKKETIKNQNKTAAEEAETAEEASEPEASEEETSEEEAPADEDADPEPEAEEKMPERNEDGYFVLKFCPKCKVGNHPDAAVCVNCGADLTGKED